MIDDIDFGDLYRKDLNLLVLLVTIARSGGISAAAKRLNLGQPAVSSALNRARDMFDDPLFIRQGKAMVATDRCAEMLKEVEPILADIHRVLQPRQAVDPATLELDFRIGLSAEMERLIMPSILAEFADRAPRLRFAVLRADGVTATDLLESRTIDLYFGVNRNPPLWHKTVKVHEERFTCLHRSDLLKDGETLSLDHYIKTPHILLSFDGTFSGVVDQELEELGLKRHVAATTTDAITLAAHIIRQGWIATLPKAIASGLLADQTLQASKPPITLAPFNYSLRWREGADSNKALQWIRQELRRLIGSQLASD